MPKYYTTMRIPRELHKKIVRARAKLEQKTGERHSLVKTMEQAIDYILDFTA
jgi:hypothetical protein